MSKYIHAIERKFQQCLDKLNKWATENGFRFSQTKTKCMHFCHKRKLHNDPCLKLERTEIPVVNEYKFLDLVFDKKLTFIPHLKYLRFSCNKRLQLLRVIAHIEWGADRGTLLNLYRSLIRSKLDYGSFIYQSARKTYFKILNPICYEARMSPVESLYAEGNEVPANIWSNKLAIQYYAKLKSCPSNPAYNATFHPRYGELFEK